MRTSLQGFDEPRPSPPSITIHGSIEWIDPGLRGIYQLYVLSIKFDVRSMTTVRVTSDCRTFYPGQGNVMLIENGLLQDKQYLVCCKDMLAMILYVRRDADRSISALKKELFGQ